MKKEEKENIIVENFVKVFNKIKRIDEGELDEISPDMRQRAIQQMRDKGQNMRANNWVQHYGTKDLQKFVNTEFDLNGETMQFRRFTIDDTQPDDRKLVIDYTSPNGKQFNVASGKIVYFIDMDKFNYPLRITRKTARKLSLIVSTVNPNTKYKNGTGDFDIINY